ncbi:MAG: tRNA 2-selenouridine(34) synthase MnmH, partial [Chitinophagales bacterium]
PVMPLIDVRSPAEYAHAHIPGAVNMPLLSDAERKQTGIAYKREGQEAAIKLGLDLVGVKLSRFVAEAKNIAMNNAVALHCWRGGMRSKSMAILFDFAGIRTYVIKGGYKSFRRLAKKYFDMPYSMLILGGNTGSGKTEVLHALQMAGEQVIDLEALAHHKGSAFGALGEETQPTTEQFENDLFYALRKCNLQKHIWLEDESHLIGTVFIP